MNASRLFSPPSPPDTTPPLFTLESPPLLSSLMSL